MKTVMMGVAVWRRVEGVGEVLHLKQVLSNIELNIKYLYCHKLMSSIFSMHGMWISSEFIKILIKVTCEINKVKIKY